MKYNYLFFLFFGSSLLINTACFKDNDDVIVPSNTSEINDFIWRGMNRFYLYKATSANLGNDRFDGNTEYQSFINSFDSPEALFDNLQVVIDEFSFLVDDYIELENSFNGITKNNGMEFTLSRYPNEPTNIFGFVRLVLPGTDAEAKGLTRGIIFNRIDGQQITENNFRSLLASDTYTIGLATLAGETITEVATTISLTKVEYTENPVFIDKVIVEEGKKIGYLMYNAFNASFDSQLNAAFARLKSENIEELVLDLRYNGGGNVETAKDLASMITGQFNGEIFSTEEWNEEFQEAFLNDNPDRLINRFDTKIDNGEDINSLQLTRVFVLTTRSSASASELIINALDPYIDVVRIGTTTRGKFQASITLYDSDNFRRQRANPGHTYAMQPLVLKSLNSVGFTDYFDGLAPDIEVPEDFSNPGVLGTPEEPLFKAALDVIFARKSLKHKANIRYQFVGESGESQLNYQKMFKKEIEFTH
ncbi:S41 family peptidase [Aquimarina sp. ERC-38]|uniref:S41 family peptidase n=1 Tax=Aquimarina sp. ERC-38 TaxID=2949996 RepID=UPI00224542C3|nr:S41 family peptidase [Aquimarina sp. ERC-38]UZO80767.1 S41 family peptidase [Aquimarina sp. ERC-38]